MSSSLVRNVVPGSEISQPSTESGGKLSARMVVLTWTLNRPLGSVSSRLSDTSRGKSLQHASYKCHRTG
jgi:hypothetical protein